MRSGFGLTAWSSLGAFAGVPVRPIDEVGDARVVIVGAPFDWGTTGRPGARFGPKAIREGDYLNLVGERPRLETGIDAMKELGVIDVGDIDLPPGYTPESLDLIIEAVETISRQGAIPIVLGGDHTVTYANATGVARVHGFGDVALIHFDAHADTAESHHGMLHGHGTPMRRLIESGAVPGRRFVQIGLRGYWPPPAIVDWMAEQQMTCHMMSEVATRGIDAVLDDAIAYAAEDASGVFVSVDIDVCDPAFAPGTGTPEPGGMTSRDLMEAVRRLGRELNIVGADIVEVSPLYDRPGDITARLANRVLQSLLDGMAESSL